MSKNGEAQQTLPPQTQDQRPGLESEMTPKPVRKDEQPAGLRADSRVRSR